jgi:hypothetical protein
MSLMAETLADTCLSPLPKLDLVHIYVVSDALGFVGAFSSKTKAADFVQLYAPTPFLIHRYDAHPEGAQNTVWMVIYRANEAVAFASNRREIAEKVQKSYVYVGLAYDDDIGYWEHPLDIVAKTASMRLEAVARLVGEKAASSDHDPQGEREAKISIMADVIDIIDIPPRHELSDNS